MRLSRINELDYLVSFCTFDHELDSPVRIEQQPTPKGNENPEWQNKDNFVVPVSNKSKHDVKQVEFLDQILLLGRQVFKLVRNNRKV